MLAPHVLRSKFEAGLSYADYVATGTPDQQAMWKASHARVALSASQRTLVTSFTRRVNVLVSSGLWCGDCAHQCPMLARIEEAHPAAASKEGSPGIRLRFLNRDAHLDLADQVRICGGHRVPTVIFFSEDFEFVSLLGDKTLSRLRAKAAKALGPSCPLPGAELPSDELESTLQEWIDEHERVHLTLRLSTRLRTLHGD